MGFFNKKKKKRKIIYPTKCGRFTTPTIHYCRGCHYRFDFSGNSTDPKDTIVYSWTGSFICCECYPLLVEVLREQEEKEV